MDVKKILNFRHFPTNVKLMRKNGIIVDRTEWRVYFAATRYFVLMPFVPIEKTRRTTGTFAILFCRNVVQKSSVGESPPTGESQSGGTSAAGTDNSVSGSVTLETKDAAPQTSISKVTTSHTGKSVVASSPTQMKKLAAASPIHEVAGEGEHGEAGENIALPATKAAGEIFGVKYDVAEAIVKGSKAAPEIIKVMKMWAEGVVVAVAC